MVEKTTDQIDWVNKNSNIVMISSRIFLVSNRARQATRPLHIGQENIEVDYIGWLLRQKSPLRKPFNVIIDRMREMAMFEYWLRKTGTEKLYENPQLTNKKPGEETLRLIDLKSVFFLWFILVIVSFIIFIVEQKNIFFT